jgi:S-adenosylmethionine:tRNA ribosyltransferase-isomerase
MTEVKHININEFNYELPDEKIAKYPLEQRDLSKLLVFKDKQISEDKFFKLHNYIPENTLLVFNDTKVINARLFFQKETGARIEIFCLEPLNPVDYSQALSTTHNCTWKCLIGNSKKWKNGKLFNEIEINQEKVIVSISKIHEFGDSFEILFAWNNDNISFSQILEAVGNIPIPPYLNRNSEDIDKSRYQTIYSLNQGSVAAPTAGLHFTNAVFENLRQKKIKVDQVTLHVGAGTFHPVKANSIFDHEMHTEHFSINLQTIENLIQNLDNITVVGTTTVRTLESTFQAALQIYNNPKIATNDFFISQWEAYKHNENLSRMEVLENTVVWMKKNNFVQLNCATQIMIVPGYDFKLTTRLITNFHQPKSTLLLLLAAFIGDSWKDVYKYALNNDFRFLSYGDSSIFIKR